MVLIVCSTTDRWEPATVSSFSTRVLMSFRHIHAKVYQVFINLVRNLALTVLITIVFIT